MTLEELEAKIRKVESIEEIKNLQARYAHLLDTFQMDKVPDLFADNFIAEFDAMATLRTKPELSEYLNGMSARASMICHQMITPLIEVDGDKATGTWHLFSLMTIVTPQGEVAVWIQGRYDNEYVRVDSRSRIAEAMTSSPNICPQQSKDLLVLGSHLFGVRFSSQRGKAKHEGRSRQETLQVLLQ